MKKKAIVNKHICVACGVCANTCPKGSISIHRGCYAAVNEATCAGCGLCAKACPAVCIEITERSEEK